MKKITMLLAIAILTIKAHAQITKDLNFKNIISYMDSIGIYAIKNTSKKRLLKKQALFYLFDLMVFGLKNAI